MRLLLDTHALIWWVAGDNRLGTAARATIADEANQVLVSAVSAMEIGRLAQDFEAIVADQGFEPLSLSTRHARLASSLQLGHKDPFDRLLIAQALVEDLPLATNKALFGRFGVTRIW